MRGGQIRRADFWVTVNAMRNETEILRAIDRYSDMLRRVCFVYTKNTHDTEDIFQDVFIKYATHKKSFATAEHEKAWLLRVCINRCKDFLKKASRSDVPLEELYGFSAEDGGRRTEVLHAVMALAQNYRTVIYLHYFEGYTAPEIAKITGKNANTVYTWMTRAKQELKTVLGGEPDA